MFSSIFKFTKPHPAPQNFRVIRPEELVEPPMEEIEPLLPNVYVALGKLADKPGPNWLRMVCISDTHNTTDANTYHIPEADILGKRLKAWRHGPFGLLLIEYEKIALTLIYPCV